MDGKTLGFGENKIDAYVSLKYKTKTLKTKVLLQPENGSISWNQQFLVPAQIPVMGGKLPFKVWDEDLTGDEVVGSFELNAKDIIGKKNGIFFWKNIYGAPVGFSNDAAKNMNDNPAMASFWKGRILIQVEAVKTEKPLLMVEDIDPELIEKARPHLLDKKYQIMVQINSAVSLPQPMTDYEVVVRVGEHEIRTGNPPFKKERYNRFNFRTTAPGGKDSNPEKDKQVTFNAPYLNIDDIGTVFVYLRGKTLLQGEQNICYYRLHATQCMEKDPEISWVEFLPDPAVN